MAAPSSDRPYLWMLAGAASFAVMSTLVSVAGERCDWQLIAVVRTFLAMVFSAGLALSAGARLVFFRPPVLWMRSLAGTMALLTGFYSLTRLATTEVLTLTNMFPLWVAVLSWPVLGRRPEKSLWAAVACGLVGVVLMQQPRLAIGDYTWLIALGSSLFSAVALLGLHQLGELDSRAIVAHFSGVSLLGCLASAWLFPRTSTWEVFDLPLAGLLLAVGITATLGQLLLTKAFTSGEPGKVSVVGLSQVGFSMIIELAFRERRYNVLSLIGIVLVLLPTAWVMLRERRRGSEST
ncbi:MAG: DMT family transporter [Pirellulales bacterium]